MGSQALDQKEYLRLKYGIGNDGTEKLKKKKRQKPIDEISRNTNFKIVDDDIDFNWTRRQKKPADDLDIYLGVDEDKPTVDGVIDERPLSMRNKDKKGSKWKPLAADEEDSTIQEKKSVRKRHSSNDKSESKKVRPKHGITSAAEMKEERKRLKEQEAAMFAQLNPKISGKGAKSVYRDKKTGQVRDLEKEKAEEEAKQRRIDAETAAERQKFKEMTLGRKQVDEAKLKAEEDALEMVKPLARYADDVDLDEHLRSRELVEDPMLAFIREQRATEEKNETDNKKPILKYKGAVPPPPNRFNIPPGHRWDGVDRSNGYEKKYFDKLAEKEAIKEEAYRWATEDM